jgi:hypothetical protein
MSATCHHCGAFDPAGTVFHRQRIPFRGIRIYCPRCHAKVEEKFLLGIVALNVIFGLIGVAALWSNRASEVGHVFVNVFLVQIVILPSVIIHEFAHAITGKLCGLIALKIWIGRGKTLYRASLLGFDTEFKMIPVGGITFLTHGFKSRLRFRYFLAILAGPLINAVILAIAWSFVSWRSFNIENSIQFAAFVVFAQVFILAENLLPYRIQTALGRLCTDGLSLSQLLVSKSPEILNSRLGFSIINTANQTLTR